MKITAITRFKNGTLLDAVRQAGWTQAELARRIDLSPTKVGDLFNLKRKPETEVADKIQRVLGEAGVYLDIDAAWPEGFKPLSKTPISEVSRDVDVGLLAYQEYAQLTEGARDPNGELLALAEAGIARVEPNTNPRDMAVFDLYMEGATLDVIGKKHNLSRERARQLVRKVCRSVQRVLVNNKRRAWLGLEEPIDVEVEL